MLRRFHFTTRSCVIKGSCLKGSLHIINNPVLPQLSSTKVKLHKRLLYYILVFYLNRIYNLNFILPLVITTTDSTARELSTARLQLSNIQVSNIYYGHNQIDPESIDNQSDDLTI